jgi:hypothetical protein
MTAKSFALVRTLPDGQEKQQGPVNSLSRVLQAAADVLTDNGCASRREAHEFADRLEAAELGDTVEHTSGYRFRIDVS